MFISNIWNKWHPLAGTTQINLVNSQARRAAQATEKVAHLMVHKRSACIIQLIPERGTFYAAFTKASSSQCTHGTHKYTNTHILPHKHRDLCLHPGKRLDSPSILPNQIYSESKLKGTFNQPLWVCLSIWEQQQSSLLGVV